MNHQHNHHLKLRMMRLMTFLIHHPLPGLAEMHGGLNDMNNCLIIKFTMHLKSSNHQNMFHLPHMAIIKANLEDIFMVMAIEFPCKAMAKVLGHLLEVVALGIQTVMVMG
jgi:hypothetical protein